MKTMEHKEKFYLGAILKMAEEDNKGVQMSTTLLEVKKDPRGAIVSFGVSEECAEESEPQILGLPSKYIACVFFIDRKELRKHLK